MRCAAALTSLALAALVASASASAAALHFQPSIRGAGAVEAEPPSGPYACSSANQDDRASVQCSPQETFDGSLVVRAVPSGSPTGHWSFVEWQGCADAVGDVCSMEALTEDATFTPTAVFDDTIAPTVTSLIESFANPEKTAGSFSFATDEAGTLECRLDAGAFAPCASPHSLTGLSVGQHTLTVHALDASGNQSADVSATWLTAEAAMAPPAGPFVLSFSAARILGPSAVRAVVFEDRRFSLPKVRVRCPAGELSCRLRIVAKAKLGQRAPKPAVVARRAYVLPAGRSAPVKLVLRRNAMAALKRRGRLKAAVTISARAGGVTTTKLLAASLRPRR
jgi:hypothetical protein